MVSNAKQVEERTENNIKTNTIRSKPFHFHLIPSILSDFISISSPGISSVCLRGIKKTKTARNKNCPGVYCCKLRFVRFNQRGGPIGAGYPEVEFEVLGRPLSKDARGSCLGVMSPGAVPNGNFVSKRAGQPLPLLLWLWALPRTWMSSSGRFTPESFHGLR